MKQSTQQKTMTLQQLDTYFRQKLAIEECADKDPSKNGIQVENTGDITRVAFAVDACAETIRQAAEGGAQMLFVHHGLFWGREQTLTGVFFQRIALLIKHNIALYACHLPLDKDVENGNNYGLARRLNLENLIPFGMWRGVQIGVQGSFSEPQSLDSVIARLFPKGETLQTLLPFGKKEIRTVAIVSGGGEDELHQAIGTADLFITGEISHQVYHLALENGITVIAGGHYQTETVGVQLMKDRLAQETGIDTFFIDVPTGL